MNSKPAKIKCVIGLILIVFLAFSQTPIQAAEMQEPIYHHDSPNVIESFNLSQTLFERFEKEKKDPSKALALSALYFGLGQFYIGDNQRGAWTAIIGSLILAGSIAGFVILGDKNRPEEAKSIGNLLIIGTLGGYYLWNLKDSFDSAEAFNEKLEKKYFLSNCLNCRQVPEPYKGGQHRLEQLNLSYQDQTLNLSYRIPL